ncbi:MAG: ROK family protein [Candidatus Dormibacteria bacterium]
MIGLLDIGGTKLLAAAAPHGGPPGAARRRPTPREAPLEVVCAMLDELRGGRELEGIGLAVPGPFDRDQGSLINPPGMPPSWHGLRLRAELGDRYGCPVEIENDANCAALAEAHHGAGRGQRTLVYFTVSTGIGTGVVRDGRVVIGRHDTEGGHQVLWPSWLGGPPCDCGGAGCLETLASGRALKRRFGRRAEDIEDQAVWDELGRWLGLAAINATALLDPDCIVYGGGVCARWDSFAASLMATVQAGLHLQPQPRLALATLGEDRNLWGALELIRPAST